MAGVFIFTGIAPGLTHISLLEVKLSTAKCLNYVQEKYVIEQCLELVKPIAISTEQASYVRALIDEETQKDSQSLETATAKIIERLSGIQEKLNKLTRGYLDELIDEESYQASKADLVIEKTALKHEKVRLQRTRSSFWNEPTKEIVNALEMAGKTQTGKSPQEISQLVQKVGTNRLISRKTVTFSFSEPYDFALSFLGNFHTAISENPSLRSNELWQRSNWCG